MAFKDDLKASLELEPDVKVINLADERLARKVETARSDEITVDELVKLVQYDLDKGTVKPTKAYITLVEEDEDGENTVNYRCNMKRSEEIYYRWLGLDEITARATGRS